MKAILRRNTAFLVTFGIFVVAVAAASAKYKGFFSLDLFVNILHDNAVLGLAAVGETAVILCGGIDLSVGAVAAFTAILIASLVQKRHIPPYEAMAIALGVSTGFGAAMGYAISKFKLPAFLITLAGMFLARGLGLVISLSPITLDNPTYDALTSRAPLLPGMLVAAVVVMAVFLQFFPLGRAVYAVGGNENSAMLMGLPISRVKVGVYALSGLCAGLAGIAYTIYTSSGEATAAAGMELNAIAAVVIGGTLLVGGFGNVIGTLVGIGLIGVIQSAITYDGTLSSWWTKIATGLLLMVFIVPQRLLTMKRE